MQNPGSQIITVYNGCQPPQPGVKKINSDHQRLLLTHDCYHTLLNIQFSRTEIQIHTRKTHIEPFRLIEHSARKKIE